MNHGLGYYLADFLFGPLWDPFALVSRIAVILGFVAIRARTKARGSGVTPGPTGTTERRVVTASPPSAPIRPGAYGVALAELSALEREAFLAMERAGHDARRKARRVVAEERAEIAAIQRLHAEAVEEILHEATKGTR